MPNFVGPPEQIFKHRKRPRLSHLPRPLDRSAAIAKHVLGLIRRKLVQPSQFFVNLDALQINSSLLQKEVFTAKYAKDREKRNFLPAVFSVFLRVPR